MPSGDTQQGNRRPLRMPSPLLPIPKSMDTNAHSGGELLLRETNEASQG